MTKPVGVHVYNSGSPCQALQDLAYAVGQQGLPLLRHPQSPGAGHEGLSFLEIVPDDGPSRVANGHPTFFPSFAHYQQCPICQVQVFKSQLGDLGESGLVCPKTCTGVLGREPSETGGREFWQGRGRRE